MSALVSTPPVTPEAIVNETDAESRLADAERGMTPAGIKPPTLQARLAPYRKGLLKRRTRGFTVAQLVTMLKHTRIGITVTETYLRKYLRPQRRAKKAATTPAATPKYTPKLPAGPGGGAAKA